MQVIGLYLQTHKHEMKQNPKRKSYHYEAHTSLKIYIQCKNYLINTIFCTLKLCTDLYSNYIE